HLDIAYSDEGRPDIRLWRADGAGGLKSAIVVPITQGTDSLAAADFDSDGHQDLAFALRGLDRVGLLRGRGDGTFLAAVFFSAGKGPLELGAADLNADGFVDIAVADSGSNCASGCVAQDGDVGWLQGHGDGTFQTYVPVVPGPHFTTLMVGDYDGNGLSDLAVGGGSDSSLPAGAYLLPGLGAAGFGPIRPLVQGRGLPVELSNGDR